MHSMYAYFSLLPPCALSISTFCFQDVEMPKVGTRFIVLVLRKPFALFKRLGGAVSQNRRSSGSFTEWYSMPNVQLFLSN
jgi:hypothetical protein